MSSVPASGAAPIRVMLVDDHPSMLWGLERLVDGARPRMEVCAKATTGGEALRLAAECRPDVVLLDLDLGRDNGLDLIGCLAAMNGTRVLVFTGVRDVEQHDRAIIAGACGVVMKAEPAETILKAIEKANKGELWLDRSATGRIFVALSKRSAPQPPSPEEKLIATLTPRERQIAAEMVKDARATTAMVASRLCISEHTLRNHLTSIYDKLHVTNRLELWEFVDRHGLGETDKA